MGKFRPIADTVTDPDNKIAENSGGKKTRLRIFFFFCSANLLVSVLRVLK